MHQDLLLGFKPGTKAEVPVSTYQNRPGSRFSLHPSVSTCYQALLDGIPPPTLNSPAQWAGLLFPI